LSDDTTIIPTATQPYGYAKELPMSPAGPTNPYELIFFIYYPTKLID